MPSQQWIEEFTLDFHRVAVQRMRAQPERISMAEATLTRWEAQGASKCSQSYRDAWRQLLRSGVAAIDAEVCNESDRATLLRSVSPLGFVLSASERSQIRQSVVCE
jgi:hypothetical protein